METENYFIYEDTEDTLTALKERGYRHILLSNNYPELEEMMGKLGLAAYFDGFVVSAKVGYDKPRREIFELAFRMAGCPEKVYMVGDNPYSDIKGANAFGIPAILVHNSNEGGFDCLKCDNLSDILEICN